MRWAKSYGFGISDFFSAKQTSDGGYITAGVGNATGGPGQAWVMRVDKAGGIMWQKSYESSLEPLSGLMSVDPASDGGFILAGTVFVVQGKYGSGETEAWVFKLDKSGSMVWEKAFGGVFGHSFGYTVADSVQQTFDGGFVVAGGTADFGPGPGNIWVVKLDSSGNVMWEEAYGGAAGYLGAASASSIEQTSDGGYIVAGWTNQVPGNMASPLLLRLDSNGKIVWQKGYSSQSELISANSVKQTHDGGFIVTGLSPFGHVWTFKTDSTGNLSWQYDFGFGVHDEGSSIELASDGGYIIGGDASYGSAALVMKLDSTGHLVWNRVFGNHAGGASIRSVTQTRDGGYLAAGQVFLSQNGSGWLLKLDSDGLCCSGITLKNNVTVTRTLATEVTAGLTALASNAVIMVTVSSPKNSAALVAVQCPIEHVRNNHVMDTKMETFTRSVTIDRRESKAG